MYLVICGAFQQTLYEYVFCIGEADEGFCIETAMSCERIPCSSVETLSQQSRFLL